MTTCVLDASAVLAFILSEPGGEAAASWFQGAAISAVNHSEVVARALHRGTPLETALYELNRLPVTVVPFDVTLSALTAALKGSTRSLGLSFADRACLALGRDLQVPVVTGDREWTNLDLGVRVVTFR